MTFYCFWECRKIGVTFMVDSPEVVERCPFHTDEPPHIDEDSGEQYPNHFEDGHLNRVFSERLLRGETK